MEEGWEEGGKVKRGEGSGGACAELGSDSQHDAHPDPGQGPVSNAIVVVQLLPETEDAKSQHQEDEEAAAQDEGVAPHCVLVDQDAQVHCRGRAHKECHSSNHNGGWDTPHWGRGGSGQEAEGRGEMSHHQNQ